MSVKYRFKTGDLISPWLPGEALKEAAHAKRLTPECRIQQAGRDDWVLAGSIPGLFHTPTPPPAVATAPHEPAVREQDSIRHELRPGGRAPETIHHLLHRSVPAVVHLSAVDSDGDERAITGMLIGVATDGLMVEVSECATILYVPMARLKYASIPTTFPTSGPARKSEWIRLHLDVLPLLSVPDGAHRESVTSHAST